MAIMQRISSVSQLEKVRKGCVVTIGNFDGVHVGHRQILAAAKEAAGQRETQLLVMTFEPHPLAVLRPEKAPGVLTPLVVKERLLTELGADCILVVESTSELLSLSAEGFVRRFLVENIRPSLVVEGESFNFGSGRSGGISTLQELGAENGFDVSVVTAKEVALSAGRTVEVSSTIVRNLLTNGDVADAAVALGRPYRLMERIIAGRGKGRRLGFPTANMKLPGQVIPAEGVYAGFAEVADTPDQLLWAKAKSPAALSIGTSATYGDVNPLLIEAHLLTDGVGRLYDKWLAIDFVRRIRAQKKFKSESELSAQIGKDCKKARTFLADYEAH
jgi:riboflavin kinase/FMN adenylyltransferase